MMQAAVAHLPSVHADASALPDLWRRRNHLSRSEIASIYTIVQRALHGYFPPELQALADDKEELVAQFIFGKVLRLDPAQDIGSDAPARTAFRDEDPLNDSASIDAADDRRTLRSLPDPDAGASPPRDTSHSAPTNAYALCAYFRRYLIDRLRSAAHRRHVSLDDQPELMETLEAVPAPADDAIYGALWPHGLTEQKVRNAARAFIAGLDASERVLLAGSFGPLHDAMGALSKVAQDFGIASYHYRAARLGITVKKGCCAHNFARTRIGRWITHTLDIPIAAENRAALLVVLNLLAAESGPPSADTHRYSA
jgi:hypothetical protein